jgi:hypothetical protein
VVGGGSGSTTGRSSGENHRVGGDWAEGRSEANWDGYQPPWEGPSQRANEEQLDATPGAKRTPRGTNSTGVNSQHASGAQNQQHPTPRGGLPRGRDARGIDALHHQHQAISQGQGVTHTRVGIAHPNQGQNGSLFLQPITPYALSGQIPNSHPPPQFPPRPDTTQARPAGDHHHTRVYPGSAPPRRQHTTGKKNTKASIKVGALNMKGRGKPEDDKWFHIWQVMREHKAGVLIVTETHLDEKYKHDVTRCSSVP